MWYNLSMEEDVLTTEHLEALRDLWMGIYPTFDIELFKANNPNWEELLPEAKE